MLEYALSLPGWAGAFIAMALTTGGGLIVYGMAHKLISSNQSYELKDPITSLFRMVGILVSLMLSLAFSEVTTERKAIKQAIAREAAAISDTLVNLQLFDREGTLEIQKILIDYTQALIDDDWPAMARDQFGQRATALKRQFTEMILKLQPENQIQKELKSSIIADIDAMSDYRLIRLNHALAAPPVFTFVIIVGFLISMACFGAYRPQVPLLALVCLYTAFIGLVLYLILSLSGPFHGANIVEPTPFEHLIEVLRSNY